MTSLVRQSYGKHCVRVSKIKRHTDGTTHDFFEAAIDIELEGDFAAAYLDGDNRNVIATDTCRNTVYALAKDDAVASIESFTCRLANHFVASYSHVDRATITGRQKIWHRLNESPHGFIGNDTETPTCKVVATRTDDTVALTISPGISNCMILKTTQSGFEHFHRDALRTLADTSDRILATNMTAHWIYLSGVSTNFNADRKSVREQLMARFLDHYSRSVQETLYFMGQAVIASCDFVQSITLTMPNKHHIKFNLEPLGRTNDNEVFVVTDEPFGFITATVGR